MAQTPRRYDQQRRASSAAETRRRIVEATFELHAEQGVLATTMKQIAARAGVGVGSVYHHFPTYDDAVEACGQHARVLMPIPTEAALAGCATRAERIRAFVAAVFGLWSQARGLERIRAERDEVAPVRTYFDEMNQGLARLATLALGPGATPAQAEMMVALCDLSVLQALTRAGLSRDAASDQVADVINGWLAAGRFSPS